MPLQGRKCVVIKHRCYIALTSDQLLQIDHNSLVEIQSVGVSDKKTSSAIRQMLFLTYVILEEFKETVQQNTNILAVKRLVRKIVMGRVI